MLALRQSRPLPAPGSARAALRGGLDGGPWAPLGSPVRGQSSWRRKLRLIARGGGGGGGLGGESSSGQKPETLADKLLIGVGLSYVFVILIIPTINVFCQAFANGPGPFLESFADEDFQHAVKMTLSLAAVAVPINTVFGICTALVVARNEFPGKSLFITLLDLPFSISPVVTGLMLVLLYGRGGWFAPVLEKLDINVVFAFPGMALATIFVTLPYVARELIPILEALDEAEEEAARTLGANEWQVFWNVTLPNIRWGLLYGVILTNARAMGEFGAVSVISGNIIGRTQTLTLYVESAYKEYNTEGAFSAAVLLSFLAVGTLIFKELLGAVASAEKKK